MVLTKQQARNLKARERELERLISMLKGRRQKISLTPSGLRGDRTTLEQKKLQKRKLKNVREGLMEKRQKIKNLLSEKIVKQRDKDMMDMKKKEMAKMMPSKNMKKMPAPRESLPRMLFENRRMPKKFNSRRFKR